MSKEKPEYTTTLVTLRLRKDTLDWFTRFSERRRKVRSRNWLLNEALQVYRHRIKNRMSLYE